MAENVLKGTIKIDAPGVKETFADVSKSVANLKDKISSVPGAAQESANGLAVAFSKATNIAIPPVKVDAEIGAVTIPKIGVPPVEVPVVANTVPAKVALDNLGNSIKPLAIQLDTTEAQAKAKLLEGTIETLEGRLGAKKEFIRVIDPGEVTKIAKFNKEIQDLEKEIARLKNIGKTGFDELGNKIDAYGNHLNKLSKSSSSATQATINLGRVIQDAPYGFIGVANNLNPLLEGFQRLRSETGSAGGALKALGGSLLGAGGIGIAISVVSSLLVVFGDKLFNTSKAVSAHQQKILDLKKSLDELKDTTSSDILGDAGSEFSKAVSAIETLRENVSLAKQGFIDKKEVVAQYNKELGDTIGNVKTLDEVEKSIASKGNAYLQLTLLKAAAQAALKKASDATLLAAENESKATEISGNAFVKGTQEFAKQQGQQSGNFTGLFKFTSSINKSIAPFKKAVNDANKEHDRFVDIFNDFQAKAAAIAKDNHFKFGLDIDTETKKTDQKFDFLFDFLPFDPSGRLKPEQRKSVEDAIDKFQKEFSGIFKGLDLSGAKSQDEKIKLALKFDADLKAGNVQFDVTALSKAVEKAFKPEDLLPPDTFSELPKIAVDSFIKAGQEASERLKNANPFNFNLGFNLSTDLSAQIDLFKTKVKQLGAEIPKVIDGIGLQGQPIELSLDDLIDTSKIANNDALEALRKAFDKIRGEVVSQRDGLNTLFADFSKSIQVEGLSTIGEAIGAALSGGDIGGAFKQFEVTLGGAVEGLGKQIIALNVTALALKKSIKLTFTNPAIGIAAGIALVAVGAAIKSLASGGIKGFAKGGFVPGSGDGDTVPAMLTPGEFVVTKDKAGLAAALFGKGGGISGGGIQRFSGGGTVAPISIPSLSTIGVNQFSNVSNILSQSRTPVDVNVKVEGQISNDVILLSHRRALRAQGKDY